jgi:tetratricopeptide (TPR) repeat protein
MLDFLNSQGTIYVSMVLGGVLGLSLYLPLMAGQLSLASPGFYALGRLRGRHPLHENVRHRSGAEEILPTLRTAVEAFDVPAFRVVLALMYSSSGLDDEARKQARLVTATGLPDDLYWLGGRCWQAELAYRYDDRDQAQELLGLLEPHAWVAIGSPMPFPSPSVAHHMGLLAATLGRYDEAQAHFTRAAGIHERLGSPNWLARTRMEWAAMLLRRRDAGDTDRARDLLDQALATAVGLGLGGVEGRCRRLLAEAGA